MHSEKLIHKIYVSVTYRFQLHVGVDNPTVNFMLQPVDFDIMPQGSDNRGSSVFFHLKDIR